MIDMLVRIQNSQKIYSMETRCRKNKLNIRILNKLLSLGFIRGYFLEDRYILILLKYCKSLPTIRNFKMISTPGHRVYVSYFNLFKIKNFKFRIYIIFTPLYGIITLEEALFYKVGGELVFFLE